MKANESFKLLDKISGTFSKLPFSGKIVKFPFNGHAITVELDGDPAANLPVSKGVTGKYTLTFHPNDVNVVIDNTKVIYEIVDKWLCAYGLHIYRSDPTEAMKVFDSLVWQSKPGHTITIEPKIVYIHW